MNDLFQLSAVQALHLVIRAAVVYVALLMLLRIGGKQQVGQMGMAHFVTLLLISNAVQNAINGGDNTITGGLVLAVVLIFLSALFAWLTYRFPLLERLIQGEPTLLILHGKVLTKHLRRERLSLHELRMLLRKQGVHDVGEVEEAVLESDGFVSIRRKAEPAIDMIEEFPRSDVY